MIEISTVHHAQQIVSPSLTDTLEISSIKNKIKQKRSLCEIYFPNIKKLSCKILIFKLLTLFVLSGSLMLASYFALGTVWDEKLYNIEETFVYNSCDSIDLYRKNKGIYEWSDLLKNQDYIIFDIKTDDFELKYYDSDIYLTLSKSILRTFTFNLLTMMTLNLKLETNNCTLIPNEIYLLMKEMGKTGLLINNTMFQYDHVEDTFIKWEIPYSHIIFLIADVLIGISLFMYVAYFGIKIIKKEWNDVTDYYCKKYYDNREVSESFKKYKFETCGLYFLSEHVVGDYNKSKTSVILGIISVLFQNMIIWIPLLPFIIFGHFFDNELLREILFYYIVSHLSVFYIYSFFYYLNLRWRFRIILCYIAFTVASITFLISYIYIINAILWFLLCIIVRPIESIGILMALSSIIFYVVFMFGKMKSYRKLIEKKSAENSNKIFEKIGLTHREMFIMIIFGMIIILMLMAWMMFSWSIFSSGKSIAGNIVSAFITPIGTVLTLIVQIRTIENKIKDKTFGVQDLKDYLHA